MQTLIINEELKTLLPPLSTEEFSGLEESISKDGCLSPIVVWNGILVDGHHRYEICMKHAIPFTIRNIALDDFDDAKLWIWKHQANRRNLTPFHRAEIALKLKEVIAAKAKERQRMGGGRGSQPLNGDSIETREELAKIAGVSSGNIGKVEYIMKHADEETKENLRRGKKRTSINQEYKRLKSDNMNVPTTSEPDESPKTNPENKDSGLLYWHKDTPSAEWAAFFMETYSVEYVRDFIHALLNQYHSHSGKEATQHFLLKICSQFID